MSFLTMKLLIICEIIVLIFSNTEVTAQEGPGIVIAHPGQNVELLCNVTENSTTLTEGWLVNNAGPYRINALRHGILIRHNASLDGGNLMVLNITKNDNRSGSEYICVIVPAGDESDIIKIADIIYMSDPTFLYVIGVPMIPNVMVDINTYGNNVTLTLSWSEPFNNLDPIVNYTVSCSGDVTCPPNFTTTDNTTRSYTITNLTTMTTYTFSVVATNSIGSGEADVVMITTPGVPAMVPYMFRYNTIINGNTVTLTLTWGQPFNNHDPIVNYTVLCSSEDRCPEDFTTTDNTTRSYTITNLIPRTKYTFSVVATNSIGSGEAGVVMFATPGPPLKRPVCSVSSVSGQTKDNQQRKRTRLKFTSGGVLGIKYQCKLNNRKFKDCESPFIIPWRNLRKGIHTITLKASCIDDKDEKVKKRYEFEVR